MIPPTIKIMYIWIRIHRTPRTLKAKAAFQYFSKDSLYIQIPSAARIKKWAAREVCLESSDNRPNNLWRTGVDRIKKTVPKRQNNLLLLIFATSNAPIPPLSIKHIRPKSPKY
jgi:hypothetical protein